MDVVLFDLDDTLYDQVMPFEMAFSDVIGPVDGLGVSSSSMRTSTIPRSSSGLPPTVRWQ